MKYKGSKSFHRRGCEKRADTIRINGNPKHADCGLGMADSGLCTSIVCKNTFMHSEVHNLKSAILFRHSMLDSLTYPSQIVGVWRESS